MATDDGMEVAWYTSAPGSDVWRASEREGCDANTSGNDVGASGRQREEFVESAGRLGRDRQEKSDLRPGPPRAALDGYGSDADAAAGRQHRPAGHLHCDVRHVGQAGNGLCVAVAGADGAAGSAG